MSEYVTFGQLLLCLVLFELGKTMGDRWFDA